MTATSTETEPHVPTHILDMRGESVPLRTLVPDAWRARGLIAMLAKRDFQSKYRSSSLGLLWSVLLPFVQGTVLAIVFTHVVKIHTGGVSYPMYVLMGSTMWSYFTIAFGAASSIIVGQSALAGKLYFPRSLLSAVPVLSALPSYLLSTALLFAMMPLFHVHYTWRLVIFPVVVLLLVIFTVVLASIIAILHVYVRDTAFAVTAGMGIWYYGTPIIYPITLAKSLEHVMVYNPMVGVVQLQHWVFFGDSLGPLRTPLIITCVWTLVLTGIALLVYRRHERIACDRL